VRYACTRTSKDQKLFLPSFLAFRQYLDKNQNLDQQIKSNINKEFLQKSPPKGFLPKNFSKKFSPKNSPQNNPSKKFRQKQFSKKSQKNPQNIPKILKISNFLHRTWRPKNL
jgi:hypothetical protein